MNTQTTPEYATSKTLLPGDYYVGDPCYAFADHDLWIDLLESADYKADPFPRILEASAQGSSFVAAGTRHGDGGYRCPTLAHTIPVDAGLIGVVPRHVCTTTPNGMQLVTMSEPFTVAYVNGVIFIGDHVIDTNDSGDEDEDEGWDDWGDDDYDDFS